MCNAGYSCICDQIVVNFGAAARWVEDFLNRLSVAFKVGSLTTHQHRLETGPGMGGDQQRGARPTAGKIAKLQKFNLDDVRMRTRLIVELCMRDEESRTNVANVEHAKLNGTSESNIVTTGVEQRCAHDVS
eukprot:5429689-Amphidinium_carterae.1